VSAPPAAGLFLSFEGIEGSGKSTQARILEEWLRRRGPEVLLVREPGGTPFSERLRDLVLRRGEPAPSPWAEMCLYAAARAQLVREVIVPALARGAVVLADRYGDASVAYQGGGRGLGTGRVRALNRWVTGGVAPRRSFLLDLDPARGLDRVRTARTFDRLESEPLQFHRKVRRTYLGIAAREPERFRVFDAERSVEELAAEIRAEVEPLL
jgi:dTMP kinase